MRFKYNLLFIIFLSSCEYIEKSEYQIYDFSKEKTETKEGKLYVNSKTLTGELVVYNEENKVIQRKIYTNGIPVGDWSFYDDEGDLVLDPFCGSGTTGVVSISIGRRFVGVDVVSVF
jgi:DNA modification methylase